MTIIEALRLHNNHELKSSDVFTNPLYKDKEITAKTNFLISIVKDLSNSWNDNFKSNTLEFNTGIDEHKKLYDNILIIDNLGNVLFKIEFSLNDRMMMYKNAVNNNGEDELRIYNLKMSFNGVTDYFRLTKH